MIEFKTGVLTSRDQEVIKEHLHFIDHVSNTSLKHGIRTIIGGGYAVDGHIGMVTRPHNDVDIQLYGKHVMTPVLLKELLFQERYNDVVVQDKGREEFYHIYFLNGIGAEIYYIQLATNPFTDTQIMIKSDGIYTEEQEFRTQMVYLNGVRFEAQSAVTELADKIYKREYRGDPKKEKHEQDIYNLRLITEPIEVDEELQRLRKRIYQ